MYGMGTGTPLKEKQTVYNSNNSQQNTDTEQGYPPPPRYSNDREKKTTPRDRKNYDEERNSHERDRKPGEVNRQEREQI
jgi:hypothetical protein